ncbi:MULTISPECIES: hypothetical protein [Streptomyces]|uniref:Ricin B lectin domain-containing protein n=1 Tax=Streptomyces caniscabiei TaxID=2746961 RepID=A0ABU4N7P5_9ACTN|nr:MULTISPECIES: hypothetical protein [Streptomyces]MBE4738744.1 hypothetical protein [Streptomyces caniscabiei]MBE4758116.1 hypothetical protein [Streptomyces caniscabiei]MBE4772038.1 hypothetical protein [Streptomyces caniscabiei]MBE4787777.1 hypothetical protein [Streptomyces caniscabiei]MBE4794492.1 hypothetical protein [Streptomyces caniscabiei]
MKIRNRNVAGMVTAALLAVLTSMIPASSAHAEAGGRWYFVNQYNGKCLKGNGEGKALSLATCKNKDAFHWINYGQTGMVNFSLDVYPYGAICINNKGRGKTPNLKACGTADTSGWRINSAKKNAKTGLVHIGCGYLQAVSKTKVVCTKRPKNIKKMTYIVKYSLK